MRHGRSREWALQVPGNSNIWRPLMSQTVIWPASDYCLLYRLHSLVADAYADRMQMQC